MSAETCPVVVRESGAAFAEASAWPAVTAKVRFSGPDGARALHRAGCPSSLLMPLSLSKLRQRPCEEIGGPGLMCARRRRWARAI